METFSLPDGQLLPWKRAVVVEDTASRRAADYPAWLVSAPRTPAENFEPRWQDITRRLEAAWINIVPAAVEGDTLIVIVEYKLPVGPGPYRRPDEIAIPGHTLPRERLPGG